MTLKLAWRNLLRNKRRTLIAATAIAISLACLILYEAFMLGMTETMIRSATDTFLGQAQIVHARFDEDMDVNLTLTHPDHLLQQLGQDPRVQAFAPRIMSPAMISSPANMSGIVLVGVDPTLERPLSLMDEAIREGSFLDGDGLRDLVIGSRLARDLEVGLGDRVGVTVNKAHDEGMAQELFRISGITHFGIREMDQGQAFIRLPRAQSLLGLEHGLHQIAIRFHHLRDSMRPQWSFWSDYSGQGNEARPWTAFLPQIQFMLKATWAMRLVMGAILLGIVVFGIINTLFMSLYERLFEFSVLRALGTRPGGIRRLMLMEAGALGLVGSLLGILLGLVATLILARVGLDYRGIEVMGAVLQERVYPVMRVSQYVYYPLAVWAFTLLTGLYPALSASRMPLAATLRKSL